MWHRIFTFLLSIFAIGACGSDKPSIPIKNDIPAREEIERIYQLYLNGQYEAYVNEMASCDGMPESYRQQMVALHKQHARLQKEKNGGVRNFTIERIAPVTDGIYVNVFLRIHYVDHNQEEILLSMVKENGRWRMK